MAKIHIAFGMRYITGIGTYCLHMVAYSNWKLLLIHISPPNTRQTRVESGV
jgi:hypothetical protein